MTLIIKIVAVIALTLAAGTVMAQQGPLLVESFPLTDSVYKIVCSTRVSTNTVALVGPEGVLLVDAGRVQTADLLKAEILKFNHGDPRYMISTHHHGDHVGGNRIAGPNTTIIAHKNTRQRLTSGVSLLQDLPANAIPSQTIDSELTLQFNGETIRLIPMIGGHTDNDILVYLVHAKVVCLGDNVFADLFPYIDWPSGGHLDKYMENVIKIIDMFPDDAIFVAGHGPTYTKAQVRQFYEMMVTTNDLIRAELDAGKTVREIELAEPLRPWDLWGLGLITNEAWIETIAANYDNPFPTFGRSIVDPLFEALANGDGAAAVTKYRQLQKEQPESYDFDENSINNLGYWLIAHQRLGDATPLFKLNVEEHPESWNVFDSYGEALLATGDTVQSIQHYKKSLELNPDNENAINVLSGLGVE